MLGINYFYLYEDEGSNSHKEICNEYDNVHLLQVMDYIDNRQFLGNKQTIIYNKFIEEHNDDLDYVFFIDLDEFIAFGPNYDMYKLILDCDKAGALFLPWKIFGADGNIDNQNKNVVNTFKKGKDIVTCDSFRYQTCCKSFVKLRGTKNKNKMSNQHCHNLSKTIIPIGTGDLYQYCWINHYITKSWEEWCTRLLKRGQLIKNFRRIEDFFIYNPDMLPLKDELYKKPYLL
jgi:hypothetical protein